MTDLLDRLPVIARLLLANHRATLGEANIYWIQCHLDHNDWRAQDVTSIREMLPRSLWWLLRDAGDD